jgi:UDP-GlcNAc:undecaprenyl-phosphate GlcNAc-1-phosphate transferase
MAMRPYLCWSCLAFVLGALYAAALTPRVIRLAWRLGAVDRPRPDRWHHRPTALLGGIALYAATVAAAALVLPRVGSLEQAGYARWLGLWMAATMVFLLGLLDDRRGLGPGVKLAVQAAAAMLLVASGVRIPCVGPAWAAAALTILWVVSITNAVNLLDNMDGAVAGSVAVMALTLAALGDGPSEVTVLALCLAGACCGFLLYNFHPARIFMGDCGSLFLGFGLSALSLMAGMRHEDSATAALLAPVAVLAVPIFDTTLVIVARRRHRRPIMQGGRDHTSHRLVALGLSETSAVLLLYAGSALLGAVALVTLRLSPSATAVVASVGLAVLGFVGTCLEKVPVYGSRLQAPGARPDGVLAERLTDRPHARLEPGAWSLELKATALREPSA